MKLQNDFIEKLVAKGKRIDGRKLDEIRKIVIEDNYIKKAEGSALVSLGGTKVLAGVKLGVGTPFQDSPDEGVLMTGAEFSPISYGEFEPGRPSDESIELARVVDRGIRESGAIDVKKLCVREGELVWMVFVDINILDNFGNLIDASALAATAALNKAVFPKLEDDKVIFMEKTKKGLPVKYNPIACTFSKIGGKMLLDANIEEEKAAGARLTVTTRDDGNVCAMQKGGNVPLTEEEIGECLDTAVARGKEARKLL